METAVVNNEFEFHGCRFAYCDAKDAHYWLMLPGGQFYGVKSLDGQGCLRTIEKYLQSNQGNKNFRLTFSPSTATETTFRAWCKKWSKRVDAGYIN